MEAFTPLSSHIVGYGVRACADGLGIAVDAPYSKELQRLLSEAFAAKKVVAAVGRGVAALLSAKIADPTHPHAGMPIVYGKQVPYPGRLTLFF